MLFHSTEFGYLSCIFPKIEIKWQVDGWMIYMILTKILHCCPGDLITIYYHGIQCKELACCIYSSYVCIEM